MPTQSDIWTENFTVRSYDVDTRGTISPVSLCKYILDTAGHHAHELGLSVYHLKSESYTWVLSRMSLHMIKYPSWGDTIAIHTWPSGIKKLFALRDFKIIDSLGATLGTCVTAWLIIDEKTRRPVRVGQFLEKLKMTPTDTTLQDKLDKLPALGRYDHEQRFRALHRDLDVNRHVTGVSYIEWALECIPVDILDTGVLSELEINYLAETYFRDHVISRCVLHNESDSTFLHSIVREEDNRELTRLKTVWKRMAL